MFINRKWNPALIVDDYFLELPEIRRTIDNYKGRGLAIIIELFTRMIHMKGTIGMEKNLDYSARRLGMHKSTMIKIMKDSCVFVVDDERKLFYSPCLRGILKLEPFPSSEELDDIAENGNIYLGWCKKHSRQKEYAREKAERIREKRLQRKEEKQCPDEEQNKRSLVKESGYIEKTHSQSTDNQAKHIVYKDKYISSRNILTTSNNAFRNNISPCSDDDDDDENILEKYFKCHTDVHYKQCNIPRNSTSGINNRDAYGCGDNNDSA